MANREQRTEGDQYGHVLVVFRDHEREITGDLRFVVSSWIEGYEVALPYLMIGDKGGFDEGVSVEMKDQLHLSTVAITNICGWAQWQQGEGV